MDTAAIAQRIAGILTQTGASVSAVVIDGDGGETSVRGMRTALRRSDVNMDMGLAGHYEFSLLVPASYLASVTVEPRRSKVRIGAAVYRVLASDCDAIGTTWRLHLGGVAQ